MDQDAGFILAALGIICGSLIVISSLKLLRSYVESRARRAATEFPRALEERLHLIQNTVEATAIEVERVAEANRYLTRILSEGAGRAPALPTDSNRRSVS
jgi:hypothetical protein